MIFKYKIEAPEKVNGKFTEIITPYGVIKYRKKMGVWVLYFGGQVKEFRRKRKMTNFIKAYVTNRFLETHKKGLLT